MRILAVSGSLRAGSHNTALLGAAIEAAPEGVEVELFDPSGIADLPQYDQDLDREDAPEPVTRLREAWGSADAILFATPEYNGSIPGSLKNAIDWASRPAFASVLAYKPVAIMATSRGPLGGARCLEHMKVALDSCLSRVTLAREVIVTAAETKIKDGRLVDEMSLGFASGAVEALLHEIALWNGAKG